MKIALTAQDYYDNRKLFLNLNKDKFLNYYNAAADANKLKIFALAFGYAAYHDLQLLDFLVAFADEKDIKSSSFINSYYTNVSTWIGYYNRKSTLFWHYGSHDLLLLHSIANGKLELLNKLLPLRPYVNILSPDGIGALHALVKAEKDKVITASQSAEIFKTLLWHDIDPYLLDSHGKPALYYASIATPGFKQAFADWREKQISVKERTESESAAKAPVIAIELRAFKNN